MFKFTAMLLSSVLFSSAAYSADESVKSTLKPTSEYVPGQLIVKYKESATKSISRPMNAITKKVFRASQAELLEFDQIIDLEKMMSALKEARMLSMLSLIIFIGYLLCQMTLVFLIYTGWRKFQRHLLGSKQEVQKISL